MCLLIYIVLTIVIIPALCIKASADDKNAGLILASSLSAFNTFIFIAEFWIEK